VSDNEASVRIEEGAAVPTDPQVEILGRAGGRFGPVVAASLGSHPSIGSYLGLLWKKFDRAWNWYEEPDNQNLYYARLHSSVLRGLPVTFLLVSPLSIVGLALALPRRRECAPLLLAAGAGLLAMLLALPLSRYRAPVAAILVVPAGWAVSRMLGWALSGEGRALAAAGLATAILLAWTGRAVGDRPPIRAADYLAPYEYFWFPRAHAASRSGDVMESAWVLEDSLEFQPPELLALGSLPRAPDRRLRQLAGGYSTVYAALAGELEVGGRRSEAAVARTRARFLAAVAGLGPGPEVPRP